MFEAARQTIFIFKKDFGDSQALQFCCKESKCEEVKCLARRHGRRRSKSQIISWVSSLLHLSVGDTFSCAMAQKEMQDRNATKSHTSLINPKPPFLFTDYHYFHLNC